MAIVNTIEPGLSFEQYRARPGLSISQLKELKRSPLHYKHLLSNPKDSEPFALGRAAHCAVLEPDRFDSEYATWSRRTSSNAMAPRKGRHWDAFIRANASRSIITDDQFAEATGMRDAVRQHPDAAKYLRTGSPEVSLFWSFMGRQCRGRVDWLHESDEFGVVLVGLKSTRDVRLHQFSREAARMGYHFQWAYYHDGWKTITGRAPDRVVEICVETKPPHAVGVYTIQGEELEIGSAEYMALLEQLDEREQTNKWPGPNPTEQVLVLPSWVYGEEEISYVE